MNCIVISTINNNNQLQLGLTLPYPPPYPTYPCKSKQSFIIELSWSIQKTVTLFNSSISTSSRSSTSSYK